MEDLCLWTKRLVLCMAILHSSVLVIHSQMDFTIFELSKNRADAKQYCIDQSFAGLAVLDTREKMDAVLALPDFKDSQHYWVGIKQTDMANPRETTFKWDSATASSWAAWNSGEPNHLTTEHCARIRQNKRELANMDCFKLYYFVCETAYDAVTTEAATTEMTTQAPETTTEAPNAKSGFFPIIFKDQTLSDPHAELQLFSGSTRSEIECVVMCAKDVDCKYLIYVKSDLGCSTYSSSLQGEFHSVTHSVGTNIREKIMQ